MEVEAGAGAVGQAGGHGGQDLALEDGVAGEVLHPNSHRAEPRDQEPGLLSGQILDPDIERPARPIQRQMLRVIGAGNVDVALVPPPKPAPDPVDGNPELVRRQPGGEVLAEVHPPAAATGKRRGGIDPVEAVNVLDGRGQRFDRGADVAVVGQNALFKARQREGEFLQGRFAKPEVEERRSPFDRAARFDHE